MNPFGRRREMENDLHLYRNLLALLPYCVRVQKVLIPPQRAPSEPVSVVYFRPSRRRAGKHLGWS